MFDDVGHLMERHLWGFCIGHAGEPHAPTPFGIHEIIGTLWQNKGKKSILVASDPLRALLNDPNVTPMPPVTAELLRLSPTSGGEFGQKATTVVLGRFSAGDVWPEWENEEEDEEGDNFVKHKAARERLVQRQTLDGHRSDTAVSKGKLVVLYEAFHLKNEKWGKGVRCRYTTGTLLLEQGQLICVTSEKFLKRVK